MHDRRRRIAVVERRGIDDRLERRARLAQRLGGAVELALVEREAADHGEHAAGPRIHHHHGAGDFRQSGAAGTGLDCCRPGQRIDIDHVAGRQAPADTAGSALDGAGRRGFAHFTPSSGMMPISRSLTTAPPGSRAGCKPIRADWSLASSTTASRHGAMSDSDLTSASLTPQSPVMSILLTGAAPALRLVVIDEAVGHGLARHHLHLRIERGAHRQAALVELLLAVVARRCRGALPRRNTRRRRYARRSAALVTIERLLAGLVAASAWLI